MNFYPACPVGPNVGDPLVRDRTDVKCFPFNLSLVAHTPSKQFQTIWCKCQMQIPAYQVKPIFSFRRSRIAFHRFHLESDEAKE